MTKYPPPFFWPQRSTGEIPAHRLLRTSFLSKHVLRMKPTLYASLLDIAGTKSCNPLHTSALYSSTKPGPRTIDLERLFPSPTARIHSSSSLKSIHTIPMRYAMLIGQPTVVVATGRTISGGMKSQDRVLRMVQPSARLFGHLFTTFPASLNAYSRKLLLLVDIIQ